MWEQSTEVEHEYNNLKILVEKTKNQIEYLNSEKEKTGGFQDKISAFMWAISTSDQRTKELKHELQGMQQSVDRQIARSQMDGDNAIKADQLEEVNKILEERSWEVQELRAKKEKL